MVKKKVTLINGEEKEIEIMPLGGLVMFDILDKHLKINSLTTTSDGQIVDLKGSSLMLIQKDCLIKGIKGIEDLNLLSTEDCTEIFEKYYSKSVKLSMSLMGGNPN